MSSPKKCRTRLLSDAPASKDDFGAHQRVADAISDIVEEEEGGRSIGLQGGWGSGKSTILNLLSQRINKNPNSTVVTFDAWAHQGDPLRRTFLETLIKRLQELKWVDESRWTRRREELARRRKITETKSYPRLQTLGVILAVGITLVPLGLALLNSGLREAVRFNLQDWRVVAGFLLAMNPLLVLLGAVVVRSARARVLRWMGKSEVGAADAAQWGAILAQRYETDTKSETLETPDPTSVEFEESFTALMGEALQASERRLVLALDNLDRVEAEDARSILSTLQTFLQHTKYRDKEWFKGLWILVPYDYDGLRRLWMGGEGEGKGKEEGDDEGKEDNEAGVAAAFVDKSFQIRFEVPPLLLSDWRTYLINLLRQAFPDHAELEFPSVYRIYALCRQAPRLALTPRNLKLFVNQIGSIHRQWGDAFPLMQVAYYVLLRASGRDVVVGLRDASIPEGKVGPILGQDPRDNLAAMAFNVEVPQARQLLLQSPIEDALGNGDAERLREFAAFPGFWEVLEEIPFRDWAAGDTGRLASAARALQEDDLLKGADSVLREEVTRALCDAATDARDWTPFDLNVAAGILCLLKLAPASRRSTLASSVLSAITSQTLEPGETPDSLTAAFSEPMSWAEALLQLLRGLRDLELSAVYSSQGVTVPTDAEGFIAVCAALAKADDKGEFWQFLLPRMEMAKIMTALGQFASQGKFAMPHVGALGVLEASVPKDGWKGIDQFVGQINTRLRSAVQYTAQEVSGLLAALWELRSVHPPIENTIRGLAAEGYILHHLHYVRADAEASAWCLISFLKYVPNASQPPSVGNSADGYSFLQNLFTSPAAQAGHTQRLVALLSQRDELGMLLRVLDSAPASKALVVQCIRRANEQKLAPRLLPSDDVLRRWPFLQQELGQEEFDELIVTLVKDTSLVNDVSGPEFDLTQCGLYAAIVRAQGREGRQFRKWCAAALGEIDGATWQRELQEEGDLVELVVDLIDNGFKGALGDAYQDALVEHGKSVIGGGRLPEYLFDHWQKLPRVLRSHARKMLRARLCEAAEAVDGKVTQGFFDLYGKEISDPVILRDDGKMVSHLFTPLLKSRNVAGLRWIAGVFAANPDLLDEYDPKYAVDDFRDRLRTALADRADDEAYPLIQHIARAVGVTEPEDIEGGE